MDEYDDDYGKSAKEAVMDGKESMSEEHGHEGKGMEHETIHIPKDMLPQGMAEDVNVGDILEFRVTGKMDGDGDVPVEYNYGEEKEDSYAKEAAEAVSPRNKENPGETY